MESVISLIKTRCIRTTVFHAGPFKTLGDVEYASRRLGRSVEQRAPARHPLMITPSEAEQAHYAALTPQEQPV